MTCQELNQEATAVAIVQSVLRITTLCVAVPLKDVNAHHKTSFQSESCLIDIAQEFGQVHTFVLNVLSTVQSVLYLTILFLVVHHIVVNAQEIITLPSACSKIQVITQLGIKKLVRVASTVKSVLNTCNLVEVAQPLKVTADWLDAKTFEFATHVLLNRFAEKPDQVFQETNDISVVFNFTTLLAILFQYDVNAQDIYMYHQLIK